MDRLQLNVRMEPDLIRKVEQKRILLAGELGYIPTRSEVLRLALEQYLVGVEIPRTPAGKHGPKKPASTRSAKTAK